MNISFAPVHFVGNQSLTGLFPIEDETIASDAGPIGFASSMAEMVMISGVPEQMEDDTLLSLVSAFGNSSILHRYATQYMCSSNSSYV